MEVEGKIFDRMSGDAAWASSPKLTRPKTTTPVDRQAPKIVRSQWFFNCSRRDFGLARVVAWKPARANCCKFWLL